MTIKLLSRATLAALCLALAACGVPFVPLI